MKKLIFVLAGALLWTAPLMAESYSWVDESGTYNFTEDYSRVPKKYRSKVGKRGDMGGAPAPKESVSPSSKSTTPPKNEDAGKSESAKGNFDGKSYDQWKQELGDREAAMGATKKRVEEMDERLKTYAPNTEEANGLISERNKVVEQFNDMRSQYDQNAEKARKAGIKVNIAP